jgi:carboxylesterase type B
MKFSVIFCAVFILQTITFATSQVTNLGKLKTVRTIYGGVTGIQKKTLLGRDYYSFQGIPYMKPPLGKLRFTAPEPPTFWLRPFDATKEPPAYTQIDFTFTQQLIGQEDAGVINVYTPSANILSRLPVLVWIHGGSFHVSS